jgi:hypothetical protein
MKTSAPMLSFTEKVQTRMNQTGESWSEACSFFGRRGGYVSGLNRGRKAEAIRREIRNQEAKGIR